MRHPNVPLPMPGTVQKGVALAAVFVLKLIVLQQLRGHPLTQANSGLDTTAYADLARQVVDGNWGLGPSLYYVSPFYIYFLAAGLAVFKSFTAVRVLQIALGTVTVGLVFASARVWFGERAAWIAAALAAFTGLFTFYEVLIVQASVDAFLTSTALYFLTLGVRPVVPPEGGRYGTGEKNDGTAKKDGSGYGTATRGRSGYGTSRVVSAFRRNAILLAGLIFGLQTLNRPNVMLAAIGITVVMVIVLRRIQPAVLLVAGLAVGMAPAAVRNVVVAHEWTFVSSHGGLNFYIGNREGATGFYLPVPGITPAIVGQEIDARRVAGAALGHPVNDAEASDYFVALSRRWMMAHPLDAAALFLRKLYYTFNAAHVPLPHSYPFYAYDENTALRFYVVGPWLLIPLGLAGLVFAAPAHRTREYLIWASFVPAYAAAVALFFVAERYRLPLLVPLCAASGAAIDAALRAIQVRRWRSLAAGAGAVAVLAIAANWRLGLDDGRWLEGLRTAQQLAILQRYDEADRWAERLDTPGAAHYGAGRYGLGAQLLMLGHPERALPHLQAAHRQDPSNARTDYALGQALLGSGRAGDAVPHLRRGFDAGIELPKGGLDLALALQSTGDLPGAAAIISRVNPSPPDDVEAWLRVGRLAAEVRAPQVAEPFFRRAVQLRPGQASTHQQLGLTLLVLERFDAAARELAEASRLDPRDPDSLSHLAYCELKLGRAPEARSHALAALALKPDDPLAKGIIRAGGSR